MKKLGIALAIMSLAACDDMPRQLALHAPVAAQAAARPLLEIAGSPSPDGRYFLFSGPERNLAVRDLSTGEDQYLTQLPADEYANQSRFSPDGRRVAFEWSNWESTHMEFRVLDRDGTGQRTLMRSPVDSITEWVSLVGWTPDGTRLLGIRQHGRGLPDEVITVAVTDGATQTIAARPGVNQVAMSPDGRYLVYDTQVSEASARSSLRVVSLQDGSERRVTDSADSEYVLGWGPGDLGLFYFTPQGDGASIWRVHLADGRATGKPQLVASEVWGLRSGLGFARDALFFHVPANVTQVLQATIDPAAARVVGEYAPLTEPIRGDRVEWLRWSPDGAYLAYDRLTFAPWAESRYRLVVRSVSTGVERSHGLAARVMRDFDWDSTGQSIGYFGSLQDRLAYWKLDLQSGVSTLLADADSARVRRWRDLPAPVRTRDGRLSYWWKSEGGSTRLVALDVNGGPERTLYTAKPRVPPVPITSAGLQLSPDGSFIAFTEAADGATHLMVVPASGGEARSLHQMVRPALMRVLGWTPDSRRVLAEVRATPGGQAEAILVSLGQEPIRSLFAVSSFAPLAASPDGRHIAFTQSRNDGYRTWVLENLSSLLAGQR